MAVLYTTASDEKIIDTFLQTVLPGQTPGEGLHKWYALRIALALSLKRVDPPTDKWEKAEAKPEPNYKRGEYRLQQATGEGKTTTDSPDRDYTQLFKAIIGVYHQKDTFANEDEFVRLLRWNIRRGLAMIKEQIDKGNGLFQFLSETLFEDIQDQGHRRSPEAEDELAKALAEIEVRFVLEDLISGPRLNRYLLHIEHSGDYDRLRRRLSGLSHLLGLGEGLPPTLHQTRTPKVVALDIPRPEETWRSFGVSELAYWLEGDTAAKGPLPLLLGVDVTGKPFGFDLTDAPHLLVGGTTGSGKSVCLRALLYSLMAKNSPEDVLICLIDPKRVEFENYKEIPHLYQKKVYTEVDESIEALTRLVDEMEERTRLFAHSGFVDIRQAQRAGKRTIPRLVVFVDELADLMMQSKEVERHLVRVAQKGRAMGIHLVLATQRPDADTFSGLLRSNVPSKIALSVRKVEESRIILGQTGAEKLTGKGDMLAAVISREPVRIHGMMVEVADVTNVARRR
jgi:S-DNA-T family DNA segregation ATPase FtsK/SpoIIIE